MPGLSAEQMLSACGEGGWSSARSPDFVASPSSTLHVGVVYVSVYLKMELLCVRACRTVAVLNCLLVHSDTVFKSSCSSFVPSEVLLYCGNSCILCVCVRACADVK